MWDLGREYSTIYTWDLFGLRGEGGTVEGRLKMERAL